MDNKPSIEIEAFKDFAHSEIGKISESFDRVYNLISTNRDFLIQAIDKLNQLESEVLKIKEQG